jgi:hypothetical protein
MSRLICVIIGLMTSLQLTSCSTVGKRQESCIGGDADSCTSLVSDCDRFDIDACFAASRAAIAKGQSIDPYLKNACYGGEPRACTAVGIDPTPIYLAQQRQYAIQQQRDANLVNSLSIMSRATNRPQPAPQPQQVHCVTRSGPYSFGGEQTIQTDCN